MNEMSAHMRTATERVPYEDEEEFEPMHGLPEIPPEGERILWQGAPTVRSIMHRVTHLGLVTLYFAALYGWAVYEYMADGMTLSQALAAASIMAVPLGFLISVLAFLAWSIAKTSVYTVTNKRVVMRVGVALSNAVNLPFAQIVGASERVCRDGTVDIALEMEEGARAHYLLLWPHVRPRTWRQVQPMLRGIKTDDPVRRILGEALAAYHMQQVPLKDAADAPAENDTKSDGFMPGRAPAI